MIQNNVYSTTLAKTKQFGKKYVFYTGEKNYSASDLVRA